MKIIRNYYHVMIVALTVILYVILVSMNIVIVENQDLSVLITIAIATEGFLFTSLSIMLASAERKFIQYLRKYGSMRKIEFLITSGMISSGFSIIFYLCDSFLSYKSDLYEHFIILGVLVGTTCFISSSYKLFRSLKIAEKFDRGEYKMQ